MGKDSPGSRDLEHRDPRLGREWEKPQNDSGRYHQSAEAERSWTVHPSSAQTLAMEVKKHWKSDDSPSKAQWAHVQGTICGRLQRYLNSWIAFNKTIVSPVVTVTCGEALEDTINATCWAFGFYPWIISLTWLQDGEPLSQDTQQSGSLLPYGNGTYQTCVSTRIPQGQEQRFTCHVRHSGKESTGTVPCGSTLLLQSRWRASLGVVAAVDAILLLLLLYVLWSNRRETISAAEGSAQELTNPESSADGEEEP
ncbi:MHC class I polypeptide-related sequence B-like isoform X4 [Urocitellus parryii]